MMKKWCMLWAMLFAAALPAQPPDEFSLDEVHLKDGSVVKGEVLTNEAGQPLIIQLDHEQVLEIERKQIWKIIIRDEAGRPRIQRLKAPPPPFRKRGLYNHTGVVFNWGKNIREDLSVGAGVQHVIGYQFSPRLSLGLGAGLDNYSREGESVVPFFLEARSALPANPHWFFSLAGGYGHALKRERFNILDAEGGLMLQAFVGYRLSTAEGAEVTLELGYKRQNATFTLERFNGDLELRTLDFNRLALRLGLTLRAREEADKPAAKRKRKRRR